MEENMFYLIGILFFYYVKTILFKKPTISINAEKQLYP